MASVLLRLDPYMHVLIPAIVPKKILCFRNVATLSNELRFSSLGEQDKPSMSQGLVQTFSKSLQSRN